MGTEYSLWSSLNTCSKITKGYQEKRKGSTSVYKATLSHLSIIVFSQLAQYHLLAGMASDIKAKYFQSNTVLL